MVTNGEPTIPGLALLYAPRALAGIAGDARLALALCEITYNSLRSHTESLAAAAGYRVAVAGSAHGSSDLLRLRRFPVNGFTPLSAIEQVAVR